MNASAFGLRSIGQVFMPAQDLARAVDFYRNTLGMPFLFEVPRMAFFDLGSVRLMLGNREAEHDHPGSILYYKVPDLTEAHAELARRGVVFDQDPTFIADMVDHQLWMAFFHDSEGNQLALMCEVAKG
jgi:methylmalonyl-CoA/ethylmalonyl-CoA epimerase